MEDSLSTPETGAGGLGRQALRKFVSLAFENEDIDSISLNVPRSKSKSSESLPKEGFEIVQMVEAPVWKYIMKKEEIESKQSLFLWLVDSYI